MAGKTKLTRPELKRHRDALERFERYLPMLKLKQQQLQLRLRQIMRDRQAVTAQAHQAQEKFRPYAAILTDVAGVNVKQLATPDEVKTNTINVAGVNIPEFEDAIFPQANYSLFATPPWVDRALADLRRISRLEVEVEVLDRQYKMLQQELTKIIQRVNLFDKVKIPESRESIRRIRIHLGDEMTAGVGRAKIAKAKLVEVGASGREQYAPPDNLHDQEPSE